ncbi:hypothetical protein [Dawidia soli]|uniref:Glycoside hydrolase family 65 n=1 Tax=Dawidia soli TaxID=2782352 RepID=A0AAP2DI14_9BACT|nr:hypothetical protein [Dawidia soli]MBT1689757.1 hypothetical protein [Dawidia soli]
MPCFVVVLLWSTACSVQSPAAIDRFALVTRHNVVLTAPDTLGALSVGNGEFAFTVDVSGLQSFPEAYALGIPLGTQAQWGWHSMPGSGRYSLQDVARVYSSCDGTEAPYAVQQRDGRAGEATESLRANPHRLHLGRVGLVLLQADGTPAPLTALKDVHQELDLWTGEIESIYTLDDVPVRVLLYGDPETDGIAVRIESSLVEQQRLRVTLDFPYGQTCHVCSGDNWDEPGKHRSDLQEHSDRHALIRRTLDTTVYYTRVDWTTPARITSGAPHHVELIPSQGRMLDFAVAFTKEKPTRGLRFTDTQQRSVQGWRDFWTQGAAVDFSACTDPRARELERRVVLSQYLTRIQCAGSLPPQETGLTMNSWYGKFHLEMHWWHATHFALWGRPALMEKSLAWYNVAMPAAQTTARWQGYRGARWQKMTDPAGRESPSGVGAFILWQQPHPLYLAELAYRLRPDDTTLLRYRDIVFQTADFMASFARRRDGAYHLCHPLIPAQEIFPAAETDDPAYELQYWHYGLTVAQAWRERLGLPPDMLWAAVLKDLAPLTIRDGLYLPNATTPTAYTDDQYRRDHPAVLGAFGMLPGNARMDTAVMGRTFENILRRWQWDTTWGWDYPMMAMTAARLHRPDDALRALLMDVPKNTYLANGHNYQDKRLRLYLPGNGGLLAAVAMMAAGWDGEPGDAPGFPQDGKWNVRWEGLRRMP